MATAQEMQAAAKAAEVERQRIIKASFDAKHAAEVDVQKKAAEAAAAALAATRKSVSATVSIDMLYAPIMALKAKIDTGSTVTKEDILNLWDIATVLKAQPK